VDADLERWVWGKEEGLLLQKKGGGCFSLLFPFGIERLEWGRGKKVSSMRKKRITNFLSQGDRREKKWSDLLVGKKGKEGAACMCVEKEKGSRREEKKGGKRRSKSPCYQLTDIGGKGGKNQSYVKSIFRI